MLQPPAPVFSLIYSYLPWHERLLHVETVHRDLPPAWLLWTEYDYVRLSEAMLIALALLHPSAVQCCSHVQSLCVERDVDDELVRNVVPGAEDDPAFDDECLFQPRVSTRLEWSLNALELRQVMQRAHCTTAPFSNLRSLVASHTVFNRLLDFSRLPHLHSLSLYSSASFDEELDADQYDAESRVLNEYLRTLPKLRRLRLERVRVPYSMLCALPAIDHIDIRGAFMTGHEQPACAPTSPSLRRLLLDHTGTLGYDRMQVDYLLASLVPTSIQHLSVRARLTNHDLHTMSKLQSLTALELQSCEFEDTNALGRLLYDTGQPLLPNLQRFAIEGSDAEEINYEDMRSASAAFLHAYSRQLRHLKLAVKTDPADSLSAVLSVIVSSMPQLESLELAVQFNSYGADRVVDEIVLSSEHQTPALPALRSLTLRNLPLADGALTQLLACCPHVLDLTIARLSPLTPAVWSSILNCRRLLSLCFSPASVVATEEAFNAAMPLLSSTSSSSSTTALPNLIHFGLDIDQSSYVDPPGFARLLGLLSGSPISSFALGLPNGAAPNLFVNHLPSLPQLSSIWLEVDETEEATPLSDGVLRALEEFSEPLRPTSEQHHVSMHYYWQDGLLGVDEDELRAKYAAGVKELGCRSKIGSRGWRLFKRAQSEGEEDGRTAFFRHLRSVDQSG